MVLSITGATATDTALRFLALGDSYTIGEGVQAHGNWPEQLAGALRKAGLEVAAPQIIARTGWTTDELSASMRDHSFRPPYDLVTLLIGVNNQYRGRSLENYREEFQALLEFAIALAGGRPQRVIVVSIPDWAVTRFGLASGRDTAVIGGEIDAFNAAAAEIAAKLHVRHADITATSRDGGGHDDMLVGDGLHPSAAMYRRWLDVIEPQARAALSSP